MFRTKKDVDKHSQEIFKSIKAEKERNLRCLSIAQQYYNVRDYESAKRYVTLYLSVKDDSSVGHKLLAQCYEYFGEKDKALTEYKYSLQLDSKQPELILKVCELLAGSITVDKNQDKYWLEKGESQFPYHPTIFKLKQKVSSLGDGKNSEAVESVIMDELKVRRYCPTVHAKLLMFYVESDRIKDAYDAAFGKTQVFFPSLQWYQCGVQICRLYKSKFPNAVNENFYANYLLALERVVALSVQDVKISRRSIPECISFLARFDEILATAAECMNKSGDFQTIFNHMSGQLCYHTANILYRKIKWEENNWQEVNQLIAPLLLLSIDNGFAVPNVKKQNNTLSRVLGECAFHSSYRITQAGLVLKSMAKESENYFIEKVLHFCVANWRQRIAKKVYSTSDFKKFSEKSFFMNCAAFSKVPSELPTHLLDNIDGHVSVVEVTQPSSLHHLVWLGVQFLSLSGKTSICEVLLPVKFCVHSFTNLPFAQGFASSGYAESLSRIDVDAFLFACVYCAKSSQLQQINANKPLSSHVLPADVSRLLCSPEHEQWWECACQMSHQIVPEEDFSRVRLVLQRGLEAVRLVGNNSLPLPLLVLLGRTFANKATIESNSDHASALEARALLYWKAALPLLNKIILDESYSFSCKSIFEYFGNIISPSDAMKLINEGKRFLGMQQVKEKDYSDTMFINNENYADVVEEIAATAQPPNPSSSFVDEKILKMLTDQNATIMDRLETLFNKQELLSSNQLQLFEMVSQLTKKIDDFFLPNEYYLDTLSQAVQPLSPHNQGSGLHNGNGEATKSSSISTATFPAMNNVQQPLPTPNIQTNFPLYQPATTVSSYLPPLPTQYLLGNASVPSIIPSVPLPFASVPSFQPVPVAPQPFSYTSSWNKPAVVVSNNATVTSVMNHYPSTESSVGTSASSATSQSSSIFGRFNSPFLTQPSSDPAKMATPLPRVTHVPLVPPQPASIHVPTGIVTPETRPPFAFQNTTPTSSSTGAANSFQIKVPTSCTVVQSPSVQVPEQEDESDDDTAYKEHDPIPDFKPIIPLPDEVDVKTGEEDEEVLFESRAKLFRFVDKEWKERGIGQYKILKNRETDRVRVLMRREAVHKICANHFLSDNLTLNMMNENPRAWVYCTPDFAEEKMVIEKLCVKFPTPEIAAKFQQVFDKYKLLNPASTPVKSKPASPATPSTVSSFGNSSLSTPITTTPVRSTDKPAKRIVIASPVMKIEENTPEMTATSEASKTQFGSFTFTSKPIFGQPPANKEAKTSEVTATSEASKTLHGGFTFTSKPIFSQPPVEKEGEKVEEKRKSAFASFTGFNLSSLSKPEGGSKLFQPNSVTAAADSAKTQAVDSSPFSAVSKNTIDFSSLSQKSDTSSAFVKSKDFKGFAGAGSLVFGSVSNQSSKAPAAATSPALSKTVEVGATSTNNESTADDSRGGNADDEFVPTAEFAPVVPLPELVEVITGEEGLEVLYEEHCKLFRYVNKDWKERGVGKLKILRDPKDGSVRMLMRRDQVHKVCCNQRLSADIELKPLKTTEKAWTWSAQDFSEGELTTELFCVRFKTVEQAKVFKTAFEDAQKSLSKGPSTEATSGGATKTSPPEKESKPKLSEMFKPAEGSWACQACYLTNTKEATKCAACETPKDGTAAPPKPSVFGSDQSAFGSSLFGASDKSAKSTFTFGKPTSGFTFGNATETSATPLVTSSSAAPMKFSFGSSSESSAPAPTAFTFGTGTAPPTAATTATASVTSSSSTAPLPFSFGSGIAKPSTTSTSSVFNFGGKASVGGSQFSFAPISSAASVGGSSTSSPFAFGGWNSTPQKAVSGGLLFGNPSADNGQAEVESSPKNKQKKSSPASSGNNVSIFSGNSLPKSTETSSAFKSFSFNMGDQEAASAPTFESLAKSVETVQNKLKEANINRDSSTSSDEVEFVSETKVSDDDKKLAESLQLPSNYFAYKYSDDCPGCAGCDEEDLKNRSEKQSEFQLKTDTTDKLKESNSTDKNTEVTSSNDLNSNAANKSKFIFGGTGDSSWLNKGEFKFGNMFTPNLASPPKATAEDEASDDEKDSSVVTNDHDPYFEPVVPLPEIVETKTGEEEEEIVFHERSKLFRFDEDKKEWKERGVGVLKILYHPEQKSYRLLLRRDQVHKVVLNQRITPLLNLQPLSTSKNSWCWFGMNMTEESDEPVLEKLAARFKTEEITNTFRDKVNDCISQISEASEEQNNPSRVNETASSQGEHNDEEDEDGDSAAEDENYDEYYGQGDDNAEDYYVDEQGIEDAMEDLDYLENESETVFQNSAMLQVIEGDTAVDYPGVVKVVKNYDPETDTASAFVEFSTPEIPSLYRADIVRDSVVINEGDCITFPNNDAWGSEGKVVLRFTDELLAFDFSDVFDIMKQIDTDGDAVADQES